jgi:hypothetical protein
MNSIFLFACFFELQVDNFVIVRAFGAELQLPTIGFGPRHENEHAVFRHKSMHVLGY